ncbi:hypothetical protein E2562_012272 [Oryza meyeriana var. granulata]|uniref:Uncharacterized protein n=1 Tax=Oryza meyeriana var. granulata TaxID=110450 RepID=A0A6G1DHS5_9ORYZ|nr:hypothetical protein E2562_012272 [Oryza meyeriana var. granulata]
MGGNLVLPGFPRRFSLRRVEAVIRRLRDRAQLVRVPSPNERPPSPSLSREHHRVALRRHRVPLEQRSLSPVASPCITMESRAPRQIGAARHDALATAADASPPRRRPVSIQAASSFARFPATGHSIARRPARLDHTQTAACPLL